MTFSVSDENIIHSRLFSDGTLTEADLAKLADITATAVELNRLDATTAAHIVSVGNAATGSELATAINAIISVLETFKLTETS